MMTTKEQRKTIRQIHDSDEIDDLCKDADEAERLLSENKRLKAILDMSFRHLSIILGKDIP